MKHPIAHIKRNHEQYLVYENGTTLINGIPLVSTTEEPFVCSNCRDFECDQFQIQGGKRLTGTAIACERFILREK